ncbi:hypothetical protein QN277_012280 [Acacia crassicarpa]|uniref:Amidase domain-containing protein n=1 Tax=Acacia crassicarpa TaxID=499986 RepID=A0AAE1N0L8_9FABA|nr:hypothetical protein QN277_012280 [Acacia crassicarpa]
MASQSANLWVLLGLGLAGIFLMTRKFKKVIKEDFGAFVEKFLLAPPPPPAPPKAPHPLTGLTFAVSDVFDINGYVTSFGHPDWARTHGPASQTSAAVSSLVDGGATCIGRTVVDELAFGISGENKHFGTPTNPAVHARVPGGSSGGSAVAVAADLAEFSLGIDTVGGVRVPAGFCGVLGFRPSYGAVSHMGIIPVATSLDTVGWFAKDPKVLNRVGHILLPASFVGPRNPRQIIIADDCFQQINVPLEKSSQVVIKSTEKLFGRQVLKHMNLGDYFSSEVPSLKAVACQHVNGELKHSSSLKLLASVMQLIQRHEFRLKHEAWMNTEKPTLHPAISAQLQEKFEVSDADVENWKSVRNEMRIAVNSLMKDEGVLVIPTVADFPPKLGGKEILSDDYRSRLFSLLSIASISGCCQVSIPIGIHDKCPLSVSLIARHGGDRFLLDTVQGMYTTLQEQAEIAARPKSSRNVVSQQQAAEIAKEKGNQAFKEKQWQRAIGFYTEAIKLSGNNATYYSNRAAAYLELGSFIQAEVDCAKAINLDRKNVKAYFRRGTAREMLGYYKEAADDFKYVLVLEPTNKRAASSLEKLKVLY